MKIHFCDLCNESVPQSDLDEGRAFMRKGRVICLACDRSMTPVEGHAGAESAGGAPGDGGASAAPAGGPFGGPSAPAAGPPTPPISPIPPTVAPLTPTGAWAPTSHHASRRRPSAAGAGLGLLAILLVGAVGFWLHDRIDKLERRVAQQLEDARGEQRRTARRLDQSQQEAAAKAEAFQQQVDQGLRDQRALVDGRIRETQDAGSALTERVDAFGGRIEEMRTSFDEVNRHEQELTRLQQRFTALSGQVTDVTAELEVLSARVTSSAALAESLAAAPTEAPPPAWIGLVEQLSSPNNSDRWQAVFGLKETHDPAVAEYLIPALTDEDIFIRMVTASALGELGSPAAIPALIDALEDEESAVREAAYTALRTLTKRDLPFDPLSDDAAARARRVKAWREWWEKERVKYEN